MKINLTNILNKVFNREENKRKEAIKAGKLTLLRPTDKEAEEIEKDWMTNGIPLTEFDNVASAIIYLHCDGLIYETDETINNWLKEISDGALKEKTIKKIIELQPYGVYEVHIEDGGILLSDYIPFFILQKKAGDFTNQWIEKARKWVRNNPEWQSSKSEHGGYYIHSVWMEGENPPHESSERVAIIQENNSKYFEAKKRREDPIYGGRPKETLIAPSPEWQESFYGWSLELSILLNVKYRAPEFKDSIEYDEVALEIGNRCLECISKARDTLPKKIDYIDYEKSTFKENEGMARYVRFLINHNKLEEALFVCEQCIKYGVHDGTKTGFSGRAKKIKNKIAKLNPESKPTTKRGKKGKLSDEQILELVSKYLSSSSKERQALPESYGITRSNLYYLVSKNKHRIENTA